MEWFFDPVAIFNETTYNEELSAIGQKADGEPHACPGNNGWLLEGMATDCDMKY